MRTIFEERCPLTELLPEIITDIASQEVVEEETATFACELSKPAKSVEWLKSGKKLAQSEKFEMSSDGTQCKLVISQTVLKDSGQYTIKVGKQEKTAKLTVKGSLCIVLDQRRHINIFMHGQKFR